MISYHQISLPSASLWEIQIGLPFSEQSIWRERRYRIRPCLLSPWTERWHILQRSLGLDPSYLSRGSWQVSYPFKSFCSSVRSGSILLEKACFQTYRMSRYIIIINIDIYPSCGFYEVCKLLKNASFQEIPCSTLKLWFQVFEEIYDIGSCVSEIKSTKVTFVTIK